MMIKQPKEVEFEYAFDEIGNRTSTGEGGDSQGRNLRPANYSANNLNQYTSRDVPPYLTVLGSAATNATVSLWANNGSFASTYRRNDFFRGELNFNNSTGSLWLTVTNVGVLRNGTNADIATNIIGSAFVPQTAEVFGYDADGNMTNDGRWSISWDAENRVTNFSRRSGVAGPNITIDCESDYMGRRIGKFVTEDLTETDYYFVYDGWNVVAVLGLGHQLLYSFNWGVDASGRVGGAGGVGGLVSMTVHSGANAGAYFYAYDGNFNVSALVSAADGRLAAQYEYSPFGDVLRTTGPMTQVNPFSFSTKFHDAETGLYYYGYRYLSASVGRWMSADPIESLRRSQSGGAGRQRGFRARRGRPNPLYVACENNPVAVHDNLGLSPCPLEDGQETGWAMFPPKLWCFYRKCDVCVEQPWEDVRNDPETVGPWQWEGETGRCFYTVCQPSEHWLWNIKTCGCLSFSKTYLVTIQGLIVTGQYALWDSYVESRELVDHHYSPGCGPAYDDSNYDDEETTEQECLSRPPPVRHHT